MAKQWPLQRLYPMGCLRQKANGYPAFCPSDLKALIISSPISLRVVTLHRILQLLLLQVGVNLCAGDADMT